jgi:thiamine-phosphate pyrophosphorylase
VTICLVTDRWRADPLRQARWAAEAGVDLIQVRERDLEAAALAALVTDILAATRGTATRIIVNDRLDVAIACGAAGVHLRGDSMPVAAARRLASPGFLIGRSVHTVDDVERAAGADYLIAGTVFPTASKSGDPQHPVLGVEGLRAMVRAARAPVLAIGGITDERIVQINAAGAAGFAAIGLFAERFNRGGTFDRVQGAP